MTTSITVFSKPNCVQCTPTYRRLDEKGVAYESIDVSLPENGHSLDQIKEMGYLGAPVVIVSRENDEGVPEIVDHWGGFRPDKLDEWAA